MTTYYVNGSLGNDLNSCPTAALGSTTQAKQSITAGLACLAAGDTLKIAAGTYVDNVSSTNCGTIPCGSSGNPTTISSLTPSTARSACDVIIAPILSSGLGGINFNGNNSYITFDGLGFSGQNASSVSWPGCCGIGFDNGVGEKNHHFQIINCEFKQNKCGGGVGGNDTEDILVQGNWFHDDTCSSFSHHFYVTKGLRWIVDGNIIEDATDYGSQFYPGPCYDNIFRNNIFRNNGVQEGGSGLNDYCTDDQFYNNLFINNSNVGIVSRGLRHLIYNNTAYGNGSGFILQDGGSPPSCINNLVISSGSLITAGSCSPSTTNITSGSHFIAPGTNFHLLSSSTAINFGTDLSAYFNDDLDGVSRPQQGSVWDVGCYEYFSGAADALTLLIQDNMNNRVVQTVTF